MASEPTADRSHDGLDGLMPLALLERHGRRSHAVENAVAMTITWARTWPGRADARRDYAATDGGVSVGRTDFIETASESAWVRAANGIMAAPATVKCALSGHEATQQAGAGRVNAAGRGWPDLRNPPRPNRLEDRRVRPAPRTSPGPRRPKLRRHLQRAWSDVGCDEPAPSIRRPQPRARPQRCRAASRGRCDGSTARTCLDERRAIGRVRPGREPLIKSRGCVGFERSCTGRNRIGETAENVSISKLGNQVVPRKGLSTEEI